MGVIYELKGRVCAGLLQDFLVTNEVSFGSLSAFPLLSGYFSNIEGRNLSDFSPRLPYAARAHAEKCTIPRLHGWRQTLYFKRLKGIKIRKNA